ncbi:hypothetical protein Bbelb_242260 [Branchiostoma belcheri]|nr:hypothetical protein Bbelb_242260 [Branchiostoma belcheri]
MTTRGRRALARRKDDSTDEGEDKHGDGGVHVTEETESSDFEAVVREQLKRILEGQNELQREVRALEENVEKNVLLLEARMEKTEKKTQELEKMQRASTKQMQQVTQKLTNTDEAVEELQQKCNKLERFSRQNNIRVIGRTVSKGENCVSTVENILKEKFGLENVKIERAHPDGPKKKDGDGTRQHILFKLCSYRDKVNIMKLARTKLQDEPFYFTDDLTVTDLNEKRRWREKVSQAYEKGVRYRFYNGRWRDGRGQALNFD